MHVAQSIGNYQFDLKIIKICVVQKKLTFLNHSFHIYKYIYVYTGIYIVIQFTHIYKSIIEEP